MYKQKNNPFLTNYPTMIDDSPLDHSCFKMAEASPFKVKKHKSWTQADRDEYRRENPDSNLGDPQPEGGARKRSYCARSAGIKKCKNPDENGDCPNDIARRKWKCGSK